MRLLEDKKREKYWRRWGPYLSERQWGTVREDYSPEGNPWDFFPFDEAKKRIYRWGEDGIGGICDNHGRLCFAPAFWNGKDEQIKDRLFGLSNPQGNHGEDVKELYYHLDNLPSHAYMKYLYKYPQKPFPYAQLLRENHLRSKQQREFELLDTAVFANDEYFDIYIEYAKETPEDIAIKFTIYNRFSSTATIHLLPTIWARNLWKFDENTQKTRMQFREDPYAKVITIDEEKYGRRFLYGPKNAEVLFTDNEFYFGEETNPPQHTKEAFDRFIVHKDFQAVNEEKIGSKAAFHCIIDVKPDKPEVVYLRFSDRADLIDPLSKVEETFRLRKQEADVFYDDILCQCNNKDHRNIARQALAGMLWNKQFYYYVVEEWLEGNPPYLQTSGNRLTGRNSNWQHVFIADVLSVPDKWEYPGLYAWDSAFHAIVFALIDPEFIKNQMLKTIREWYMHPSGNLPAYEWSFEDVNPPVHAWACWRVYKIEKKRSGYKDTAFLERAFHKLLINFTWWVNRKDVHGKNIFQGGFLGLDNISVFNRSEQLPEHIQLYQSDATSWMSMYCLNMLAMALELAKDNPTFEDMASKFYEHFLHIAEAINVCQDGNAGLWDEKDGFYYDVMYYPGGEHQSIKVRSLVGLMPLLGVMTIEKTTLQKLPGFKKRMDWFINHRNQLCEKVACMETPKENERYILAILDENKLRKILRVMLDEEEFLSPFGIRSLSKFHEKNPYKISVDDHEYSIHYEPGESTTNLFGGNSNWRGPVWFPLNMLFIESLQKFYHYHGDTFRVECPTGSGNYLNLWEVSCFISGRLLKLFELDQQQQRPMFKGRSAFYQDPNFRDHLLFFEYFHGDDGTGLGAEHQTGWTGLIAKIIIQLHEYH